MKEESRKRYKRKGEKLYVLYSAVDLSYVEHTTDLGKCTTLLGYTKEDTALACGRRKRSSPTGLLLLTVEDHLAVTERDKSAFKSDMYTMALKDNAVWAYAPLFCPHASNNIFYILRDHKGVIKQVSSTVVSIYKETLGLTKSQWIHKKYNLDGKKTFPEGTVERVEGHA
jgi:hypothetical protein